MKINEIILLLTDHMFSLIALILGIFIFRAIVRVYNDVKAMEISLTELLTNAESIKVKLNRVYAEISALLTKYAIHETSILKAVAAGQSNMQALASRYPQLKADSLFQSASNNQSILYTELQEGIAKYNQIITSYNIYVTNFPRIVLCLCIGRKHKNHAKIM